MLYSGQEDRHSNMPGRLRLYCVCISSQFWKMCLVLVHRCAWRGCVIFGHDSNEVAFLSNDAGRVYD